MTDLDRKNIWWVGRVPETSTQAKALVAEEPATWQGTEALRWGEREVPIGNRTERWVVAQRAEGTERQYATLQRRAEQECQRWSQHLRELEQRPVACEADAEAACIEERRGSAALAGGRSPPQGQFPAYWEGAPACRCGTKAGLDGAWHGPHRGSRPRCGSQAQSQIYRGDQRACHAQERRK